MATSSPQNSDNGPDDPSDFDKLQQQPFGAGALAPGRGNDDKEPLPGSPPGFEQGFRPMGQGNPFAGMVPQQPNGVADTRTMAQGGAPSDFDRLQMRGFGAGSLSNPATPVGGNEGGTGSSPMNRAYGSDTRTAAQGGAPSQFDQLQRQPFGAGALSNPATPTNRGDAMQQGPSEPMPGPPPGQKPIDPTQPDMGTVPVGGSVIGQSTRNRSFDFNNSGGRMNNYAQDPMKDAPGKPMSDWQKLQSQPFGAGSLANTAARPVGRSMRDHPERRIEIAERGAVMNNDDAGAAHFAAMRMGLMQNQQGMDFARQRDERNFEQQKEMFGLQQQAQGARDAAHAQRADDMWQRDQAVRQNESDVHWDRQKEMFGLHNRAQVMSEEREQQRREQERNRTPNVGFTPIPGSDYGIPTADGRPMGTLPQHQDKPKGPTPDEISKHIQDMKAKGVKAQHGKNGWTYEPQAQKAETVKVVNDQGKIVDFPADHEVPAGWKALKKKGAEGGKAPPKQEATGGASKPSSFLNF